jgi:hypothetical protein
MYSLVVCGRDDVDSYTLAFPDECGFPEDNFLFEDRSHRHSTTDAHLCYGSAGGGGVSPYGDTDMMCMGRCFSFKDIYEEPHYNESRKYAGGTADGDPDGRGRWEDPFCE